MTGIGYIPMLLPRGVYGIIVPTAIDAVVRRTTGSDARLWIKGIFGVRIIWITSVCDHKLSTNHPALNKDANRILLTPGAP